MRLGSGGYAHQRISDIPWRAMCCMTGSESISVQVPHHQRGCLDISGFSLVGVLGSVRE